MDDVTLSVHEGRRSKGRRALPGELQCPPPLEDLLVLDVFGVMLDGMGMTSGQGTIARLVVEV
jgi:hypothetical protein